MGNGTLYIYACGYLRVGGREEGLHLVELVKVGGHVRGENHVNHQAPHSGVVVRTEALQDVRLFLHYTYRAHTAQHSYKGKTMYGTHTTSHGMR